MYFERCNTEKRKCQQSGLIFHFLFVCIIFQEYGSLEFIQAKTKRMHEECLSLKMQFETLKKFALDNKIPLPPEFE